MNYNLKPFSIIISALLLVGCVGTTNKNSDVDSCGTSDEKSTEVAVDTASNAVDLTGKEDKLAKVMDIPHFKGKRCLFGIDENDKVTANGDFVAPSLVKVKHEGDHNGFVVADTIDIKVGKDTYSIELLMSKELPYYGSKQTYGNYYEEDILIYDRMVFHCNGKYVATFQSLSTSAWEGFDERLSIKEWAETKKKEGVDRWKHFCKLIDLDENTGALCFTGALFPTDIFSMTIFVAHNGQIVPVYHKNAVINDIKEDANDVKFECASCHTEVYEEDGKVKTDFNGFNFNLFSQNSLLYFEAQKQSQGDGTH